MTIVTILVYWDMIPFNRFILISYISLAVAVWYYFKAKFYAFCLFPGQNSDINSMFKCNLPIFKDFN